MKTESDLNKLLQDIVRHYGDAVQGSDGDYTLSDFVTYIVSEVMDESERNEIRVAFEALDIIHGEDFLGMDYPVM